MSVDAIEAFDRGHKQGFVHGYQMAVQDIRGLLIGIRDRIDPDDIAAIEARYHEIYKGLDDTGLVVETLEMKQEAEA